MVASFPFVVALPCEILQPEKMPVTRANAFLALVPWAI